MNIITKIYTKTTLTGLQVMVVQPDFMWVVVFSSGGSCWVWEVIPDPDPSGLPAPGTFDISGGGVHGPFKSICRSGANPEKTLRIRGGAMQVYHHNQ